MIDAHASLQCAPHEQGPAVDIGSPLPDYELMSTSGFSVNLSALPGTVILLLHTVALPSDMGTSDELETSYAIRQSVDALLSFNARARQLDNEGVRVFGMSVQTPLIQSIIVDSLKLAFPLLSDEHAIFAGAMKLPLIRQGRRARLPVLGMEAREGIVRRLFVPGGAAESKLAITE